MAEIRPVTSEALEAQIRSLLPSQQGFGEDLQATNVITPIIDLTQAAQGTTTPELLQTALAFGSQTSQSVSNSTVTGPNSPGFYRIFGNSTIFANNAAASTTISLTDGLATKIILNFIINSNVASPVATQDTFDFVIFLKAGESATLSSNNARALAYWSHRQIADVNGTLVNPSGFTPQ